MRDYTKMFIKKVNLNSKPNNPKLRTSPREVRDRFSQHKFRAVHFNRISATLLEEEE
jgi:hypothetical protein